MVRGQQDLIKSYRKEFDQTEQPTLGASLFPTDIRLEQWTISLPMADLERGWEYMMPHISEIPMLDRPPGVAVLGCALYTYANSNTRHHTYFAYELTKYKGGLKFEVTPNTLREAVLHELISLMPALRTAD